MSFETRYRNLNTSQKQAVDTIEGPVMVVAGPGTGKTELLSVRVANILNQTDTLPENILCLTFTESGQAAMRERLVGIIGKEAYKVAIHTFHSFGSEIINQNREYFYNNALFEPADELKQYEIIREIFDNLAKDDPLASTMNGEFTHLRDAQKVISELKQKSALTSRELLNIIAQNEEAINYIEQQLGPVFASTINKNTLPKLTAALPTIKDYAANLSSLYEIIPLGEIITNSLTDAHDQAINGHPTKPITAWKNQWLERDANKNLVFKDRRRMAKLKSLADIYQKYLDAMEAQSLYDYDDMIMQVVHAVEANDDLKYNLQEKYLYIMVDEFQDTNPAQLRILHNIINNPVNEGSPNILVVGDDDQAIYGFQGADVSNILNFADAYPTRKLIVVTDNYRSKNEILTASRSVISQGTDRLENRLPEINKQLSAQRQGEGEALIQYSSGASDERRNLVKSIKNKIEQGANPSEIAVLARKHSEIESLLPYFSEEGVDVRYEREENILDSPPVKLLIQTVRIILALQEGRHDAAQILLPEVLAHPAWQFEPKDLWRLSLDAYQSRQQWMEVMATTPLFTTAHQWLVTMAKDSAQTSLEPMIDLIFGTPDNPTAPYYAYFFSENALASNPDAYLEYLNALRTLRSHLRKHQTAETTSLRSLINFVELHENLGLGIRSHRYTQASDAPAVQLLTAHKSKGLEFDTVYIYKAVDAVWGQGARSRSRNIGYPANLPLSPAGDSANERLRLFYVAMTRAKNELVMTYSGQNDNNKQTLIADFLTNSQTKHVESPELSAHELAKSAQVDWYKPLVNATSDLSILLAPQLEQFKLSPTSLNNFLDVSRGGPQAFLLNSLLHFPKAKSPAASYGTAVHETMQKAHTHMVATGEMKPLEDILHDFEVSLTNKRLDDADLAIYLQKGSDAISSFINSKALPMAQNQKAEVDFKHQDVRLDEAKITGSLDMVEVDKTARTLVVTDYKTGKPSESWSKGDDYAKKKNHQFKQQLMFYKLLAEASSEYSNYTVASGRLAFIEPNKAGEVIILDLQFDETELERTRKLITGVWRRIMALDLPDTSAYPQDLKGILEFEQAIIDSVA